MIERAQVIERLANPEIPSSPGHYAGLHPRLLIGGEALNPTKQDLPAITGEQLGDFEHREYSPFSNASAIERKAYWDQRGEASYEARRQAWITGCVSTFEGAKAFFKDTEKGKNWSELYAKLGIDTQNFTAQTAEGLYNRYFQPNTLGIKQFVADILSVPVQESNLSAIGWVSHIFGNVSSEMITQIVMAEAKLFCDPNQLISQANSRQSASEPTRVNNLNTDEQRILNFLWAKPTPGSKPAQSVPQQGNIDFKYKRQGEPRRFPREEDIRKEMIHPVNVAANLKQLPSKKYDQIPQDQLAREVALEQAQLESWRNDKGLTNEYLREIMLQTLDHYENFLANKYGVNIPKIRHIQLVPIFGKTMEAFGPGAVGAFAFVQPDRNGIFLNFDVLFAAAHELANAEHRRFTGQEMFRRMTPDEIKKMITRLLVEVHPHEYSHLVAGMGYWYQIDKTKGVKKVVDVHSGKVGLSVSKPEKIEINNQTRWVFKNRGTPLMEAVTVELTNQWVKSIPTRLVIPAYGAERGVLHSIVNLLAAEQGISQEEAFKKVAVGYFSGNGFRHLVEELSGKTVNPDETVSPDKRISFKRPHFMQVVYALMEYDAIKAVQERRNPDYALTLEYVHSANDLKMASGALKEGIADMIRISAQLGSNINLSTRATGYLVGQTNIEIREK